MSNAHGQSCPPWGYAVEGQPSATLQAALRAVARTGAAPESLPACNGEPCSWICQVAECLRSGRCQAAVLFCKDAGLACCLANKVPGVRAAAVGTVAQAGRALARLGANLLVVEMAGRTFFECRQILSLCRAGAACPPEVAALLTELDGHAHR
jgi:hypothetical protein